VEHYFCNKNKLVQNFLQLLKVSFKLIQPRVSQELYREQEALYPAQDPLQLHGGVFLRLAKDYYCSQMRLRLFFSVWQLSCECAPFEPGQEALLRKYNTYPPHVYRFTELSQKVVIEKVFIFFIAAKDERLGEEAARFALASAVQEAKREELKMKNIQIHLISQFKYCVRQICKQFGFAEVLCKEEEGLGLQCVVVQCFLKRCVASTIHLLHLTFDFKAIPSGEQCRSPRGENSGLECFPHICSVLYAQKLPGLAVKEEELLLLAQLLRRKTSF